jgi:hypothetical protein
MSGGMATGRDLAPVEGEIHAHVGRDSSMLRRHIRKQREMNALQRRSRAAG